MTLPAPPFANAIGLCCVFFVLHWVFPLGRWLIVRKQNRGRTSHIVDALHLLYCVLWTTAWALVVYVFAHAHEFEDEFPPSNPKTVQLFQMRFLTVPLLKVVYAISVLYPSYVWVLKFVYITFFYTLKNRLSAGLQIALHASLVFIFLTFVTSVSLWAGWCHPLERNWALGPENCGVGSNPDSRIVLVLTYAMNIATDILIFGFTMYLISTLTLRRREKLCLLFILGCGLLTIVITTISIWIRTTTDPHGFPIDDVKNSFILGLAEGVAANVSFCLPAYRGFLNRKFYEGWTRGSSKGLSNPSSSGTRSFRSRKMPGATTIEESMSLTELNPAHFPGPGGRPISDL